MMDVGSNPFSRAACRIAAAVEDAEKLWRDRTKRIEREALAKLRATGIPDAFTEASDGLAAEVAAMRKSAADAETAFRDAMSPLKKLAKAPEWETPAWRQRKENAELSKELSSFRREFRGFLASVARSVRRAYFSKECDALAELAKELRTRARAVKASFEWEAKVLVQEVDAVTPRFKPGDGVEVLTEELRDLGSKVAACLGFGAWQTYPDSADLGIGWALDDESFVRRFAAAAGARDGLGAMELCVGILKDMGEDLASMRSKRAKLNGRVERFEGECRKAEKEGRPRPETPPEVAVARRKLEALQKSFEAFSKKLQRVLETYYGARKRVCGRVAGISERADAVFAEMELDTCAGIQRYDVSAHLNAVVETDNAMVRRRKARTGKETYGRA